MKRLACSVVCSILFPVFLATSSLAAPHWEIAWRTAGLDAPTAAYYDQATGAVYVSNQNGEAWSGSGGYIAKLDPATGDLLTRYFIGDASEASPLTAPKGLTVLGDVLFVADVDAIKAFDLASTQASGAWTVTGGHFEDVVLGPGRDLFASESLDGDIYRLVWSNYAYSLTLFYTSMADPAPLGLMGGSLLVGLGSDPDRAIAKIDVSTQEAFDYVPRNPGGLAPRGLDTDDDGGVFFTSGESILQADRDGAAQVILTETGTPSGLSYARSLGLLLVANPDGGMVTAYRLTDLPQPPAGIVRRPMAAGGEHGLALPGALGLYGWGYNSYKQASVDSSQNVVQTPERIDASTAWRVLAGGWQHSMGIKTDGSLWGWGWNWYGQLGLGTQGGAYETVGAVTRVGTLTGWTGVSCGDTHTLAIRDGALYAFGNDDFGQIGAMHDPITPDNRPSPVLVDAGGTNLWTQAAAGGLHSLALRQDGALYAWGYNSLGQLGLTRTSAIDYRAQPTLIDPGPWRKVCGGTSFSAGVKQDGSLWAWGDNQYGQLGQGMTSAFIDHPVRVGSQSDWTDLSCGHNHVLALRGEGTLWGFGLNNYGQLGLGDMTNRPAPAQAGERTDWSALSCGNLHSLAMTRDGALYGFGDNRLAQLGRSGVTMLLSPTPLGMSLRLPAAPPPLMLLISD